MHYLCSTNPRTDTACRINPNVEPNTRRCRGGAWLPYIQTSRCRKQERGLAFSFSDLLVEQEWKPGRQTQMFSSVPTAPPPGPPGSVGISLSAPPGSRLRASTPASCTFLTLAPVNHQDLIITWISCSWEEQGAAPLRIFRRCH